MTKKQQEITLLIFWDDDGDTAPPAKWNWIELTGETASVMQYGPVRLTIHEAVRRALQMEEGPLTVAELHRARLGVQGYEVDRSGVGATMAATMSLVEKGEVRVIDGPPRQFEWAEPHEGIVTLSEAIPSVAAQLAKAADETDPHKAFHIRSMLPMGSALCMTCAQMGSE